LCVISSSCLSFSSLFCHFFFFIAPSLPVLYTLSLHDALPICFLDGTYCHVLLGLLDLTQSISYVGLTSFAIIQHILTCSYGILICFLLIFTGLAICCFNCSGFVYSFF